MGNLIERAACSAILDRSDGILQEADFGACAEGDPELLARQLDRLLEDGQAWGRQSANGYQYFRREHDIQTVMPAFARSLLRLSG
jgi:hypothetical protein